MARRCFEDAPGHFVMDPCFTPYLEEPSTAVCPGEPGDSEVWVVRSKGSSFAKATYKGPGDERLQGSQDGRVGGLRNRSRADDGLPAVPGRRLQRRHDRATARRIGTYFSLRSSNQPRSSPS